MDREEVFAVFTSRPQLEAVGSQSGFVQSVLISVPDHLDVRYLVQEAIDAERRENRHVVLVLLGGELWLGSRYRSVSGVPVMPARFLGPREVRVIVTAQQEENAYLRLRAEGK